jgi:SAM-dependent methyltransferase
MSDQERADQIRQQVRRHYGDIVRQQSQGCCGAATSGADGCCGAGARGSVEHAMLLGYTADEARGAPEGANLSLGCGNPTAIAALEPGETALDLGSGAGFDCFLAARAVGPTGRVIGVDMTPDMVSQARAHAASGGYANVEFRLGEIEHLPVADAQVDLIMSNCVINLSPDKQAVFAEAFRVLKPGGRLAIADTVATAPLPAEVRADLALWAECVSGSASIDELEAMLQEVGFEGIRIQPKDESRELIREWAPGSRVEEYVLSATIEAVKPLGV